MERTLWVNGKEVQLGEMISGEFVNRLSNRAPKKAKVRKEDRLDGYFGTGKSRFCN